MGVHWFWSIVAITWLGLPLYLSLCVNRLVRTFEAEAFGHFRKAARNLRYLVWAIFIYYVGVIIGGLIIRDVQAMFYWPMPAEGVVIYIRIGAVIVGYGFASLVARELYLVTRPEIRPLPGDDKR